MNRDIKFRAWDKSKRKFWYWSVIIPPNLKELAEREGLKLEQYTSLKDCTGKEIYEGDILDVHEAGPPDKTQVVWQDGSFVMEDGVPVAVVCDFDGKNCCEVIGNIYENPELLKQTS